MYDSSSYTYLSIRRLNQQGFWNIGNNTVYSAPLNGRNVE